MLPARFRVIIHVSSIQRMLPLFDSTLAYAAAKLPDKLQQGLSKELAAKGIRVTRCSWIYRNPKPLQNGRRNCSAFGNQQGGRQTAHQ